MGSAPPDIVSRPRSSEAPESQLVPTVAHFGAFKVLSKTAICALLDELTVNVMFVLAVSVPDVPVTVTVLVPVVAVEDAVNVSVDVALPLAGGVTGLVEKAAVTPLGRPEALSVVAELNPFWLVTVIVLVALEPCVTLTELGDAETVKPGAPALTAKIRSSWSL